MSIFISDFDMAKLFFLDQNNPKIFINEPLAQFVVSFVSLYHRLFEDSEWSLRTRAWKQRKKSSCVIPKVVTLAYNGSGRDRLRELFITEKA